MHLGGASRLLGLALSARSRGSRWGCTLVAGALAAGLPASVARAQDDPTKAACLSAYEGSQVSRKSQALRAARQELLACASDACPAIVRTDCVQWLAEVEAAMPTLVVEGRAASGPVFDVAVKVDGVPLATELDGRPREVDPGLHTLTFERGGSPPIEQKVIVREGEKNRLVVVDWTPKPAGVAAPIAAAAVPMERPVPASVYAGLGVAALGLVDFAVAGSIGLAKRDSLACAPFCVASEVRYVKTAYAVADVGLGVGLAALVASGVLFVTRPERPVRAGAGAAPAGALIVQYAPSGAVFGWRGPL